MTLLSTGRDGSGLPNWSGYCNCVKGRNNGGWRGLQVKNLLAEKVGKWVCSDNQKAKAEWTKELVKCLTNQVIIVDKLNGEEEYSDIDN